jgi:hypothetical protein
MTNEVALRKCPCCGGPVTAGLGLRDYGSWLADALPGRVSGSDIDVVVEQSKTDRMLMVELKPAGVPIPLGQRLLLRAMVRRGIDVWVVNGEGPVEVGSMDALGEVRFVATLPDADALGGKVRKWWNDGLVDA